MKGTSANFFHAVLRRRDEPPTARHEIEIDGRAGGRAAARWLDLNGSECWIGVVGDFVLGGSQLFEHDNPAHLETLAARVLSSPAWPWKEGDGGMIAGALYCNGRCHLFSDPVGSIPLFYESREGSLSVGTRITDIPVAADPELDGAGLLETYVYGWGIGERTAFKGVSCLPPGRTAGWKPGLGAEILSSDCPFWRQSIYLSSRKAESDCFDLLISVSERFRELLANRRVGVMLAGLDSRLILALLQSVGCRISASYTHGGRGNRECDAAARVAALYGVNHIEHELTPDDVGDPDLWEELFLNVGTMGHPHLVTAGHTLAEEDISVSMTGAAGDLLLGGTGYEFDKKTRALLALDIGLDAKVPDADDAALTAFADRLIKPVTKDAMWRRFPVEGAIEHGPGIVEQIREDLLKTLREYVAAGAESLLQIQERYKLEHRARFRAFGQERSLALHMPLLTPYFDYGLMNFCYNLHPMVKSERRMLRRLLLKRFRSLASIPVPNSLVSYTYPNPLFVFGKYLRLRRESRNRKLYRQSGGARGSFSKGSWLGRWDRMIRSEQSRARFSALLNHPWLKRSEIEAYLKEIGQMRHWIGNGGDLFQLADLQLLLNLYERSRPGR